MKRGQILDMTNILLDEVTAGWSRNQELREYAKTNRLTLEEAVHGLVNSGLSHR
jgi:hypothetical protein